MLSVTLTSSDVTKLNGSFTVERVARGGSVLTGTVDWNFDTDNETEVRSLKFNLLFQFLFNSHTNRSN